MSQALFTQLAVEHIMPGDEVLNLPVLMPSNEIGQQTGTIRQVFAAKDRASYGFLFDQQGATVASEPVPAGTSLMVYHTVEDDLQRALRAAKWGGSSLMSHKTVYALAFPRAKVLIDGPGSDRLFASIIFFHDGRRQVVMPRGADNNYRMPLDRLREAIGQTGIAAEALVWADGIGPDISTL